MIVKFIWILFGIVTGIFCMLLFLHPTDVSIPQTATILSELGIEKPIVMGFLPYWLVTKDEKDYSPYVNTISYFGLTVDADGSILKRTKPTESEPGYLALQSGKIDSILDAAQNHHIKKSLVIFSGNQEKINELVADPVSHAQNLVREISPILNQYGFTDVNIDIESISTASKSAQQNFTLLTKTIHDELRKNNSSVSLSIDVTPTALIKPYMIDVAAIAPYVDTVVFMDYDFHYPGSSVTGAVSPVNGAGTSAEYDTETSIQQALAILDPSKIILGVPLYGYEWETLSNHPHAAVIPGTGITASNARVEEFLASCSSCSAQFDPISKESYLIYKDQDTNTYHQFFYPDKQATQEKINLMRKYHLRGIALWALGYEGNTILEPLKGL